jgi:hypothetical protein
MDWARRVKQSKRSGLICGNNGPSRGTRGKGSLNSADALSFQMLYTYTRFAYYSALLKWLRMLRLPLIEQCV